MISNNATKNRRSYGSFFEQLETRALLANDGPHATIFDGDKVIQEVIQGDFDRDGKMDLVLTRATELTFLKNLGAGKYDEPRTLRLNANIGKIAKGRLNGDIFPDLTSVVRLANGSTLVRVLFFDAGVGNFVAGPRLVIPDSANVKEIRTIDIAGDVRSEIVLGTNTSIRLLSLPDRTRIVDNGVVQPTMGTNVRSAIGDLDNNGRTELLVSGPRLGTLVIGRTQSGIGVTITSGPNVVAENAQITDFDGDNINDIAWSSSNRVLLARGTGSGNFAPSSTLYQGDHSMQVVLAGFADLNHDGRTDLLMQTRHENEGRAEIYVRSQAFALLQPESGIWNPHLIWWQEVVFDFDEPLNVNFPEWRLTFATQDSAADVLRVGYKSIDLFTNHPLGTTPTLDSVLAAPTTLVIPDPEIMIWASVTFKWTNVDYTLIGEKPIRSLRLHRDTNDNGILDDQDLLIAKSDYEPLFTIRDEGRLSIRIDDRWGDLGTFRLIGELVYDDDAGQQSLTYLLPDLYTLTA